MPLMPPKTDKRHRFHQELQQDLSLSSAPIASRMPISRVRSVTDTSMMFMMPMPPTRRLIAATAPSRLVSSVVVPVMAAAIWVMSLTLKSSSRPGMILRRSRSRFSVSDWTFEVDDAVAGRQEDHRDVGVGLAADAALVDLDRDR
jgi:hypothetical protein